MKTTFHNTSVSEQDLSTALATLAPYTETLTRIIASRDYTMPESALAIAGDEVYHEAIREALVDYRAVKHVVLVGIGGSSVGTEAVYAALKTSESPSLHVLDALESEAIEALKRLLARVEKPEDIVLVVVSKSGTTIETVANADVAVALYEARFGDAYRARMIVVGEASSALVARAQAEGVRTCTLPEPIGGRYSVLTAAGIVPLTLLGIDTEALRRGAVDGVKEVALAEVGERAASLACGARGGVRTVNFFTFSHQLEALGYWYRQLLAESIGKSHTTDGTPFAHPLLPTVSTSGDLHSVAQLYLSGYADVYTKFVRVSARDAAYATDATWVSGVVPALAGRSMGDVQSAIADGVLAAYADAQLSYEHTVLESVTPYEVGYLLAQLMGEVMCLATLFSVNAFDQPHVETYKQHMREALT